MNQPHALPDPGRINFRLLHYFRVVAEEMNFTQAARRLNMSQPPLSKHIKELESQLGVVLFKRTTRSMTLTPAGRTLLRNVERLLDQADSALHQVQQMGRGEGGHMVVGMVGTSAWGGLIAALRRFSEQSAGVTWSLNELTPSQQIAALQKRHIDIGVWREAQQQTLPGLTCQRLASESIAVVLPLDHPLAQQENIPLAALQNDSFIVLPPHEASLGLYLHNLCLQQGFLPDVAYQVNEPQTLLALVAEGCGITLLPDSYGRIPWPGVRFCSLQQAPPADLYAVYRTDSVTPVVQAFLEMLRAP
ncbi:MULTISPECIES: LysR family transcriptional regulator [Serratia]|uniref:LysR family transcriptional regulator n=1 Tax=Serratia TaxID=613 RepID=UPI00188CC19F|nr:LysR family transcriptional regulator [Serratia marcescens]MBF4653861.1 LysR family transcriptional regulator [Serratia marcescens]MBF8219025.1 LysR family transcriptional regulator [Serratia ureilytica]MBF8244826.1 LysR family transcriptional regulator [Serratia ureilytica]